MYSKNKWLAKRIDKESSAAKARENAVRRSLGPFGADRPNHLDRDWVDPARLCNLVLLVERFRVECCRSRSGRRS